MDSTPTYGGRLSCPAERCRVRTRPAAPGHALGARAGRAIDPTRRGPDGLDSKRPATRSGARLRLRMDGPRWRYARRMSAFATPPRTHRGRVEFERGANGPGASTFGVRPRSCAARGDGA